MELKHYLRLVWKWLWLLALSTAIAVGISYYLASQQPKVYQSSAKLLVGQSIQAANPSSNDLYTSQQLALTYIQIAQTQPFLQSAIDALNVPLSSDELSGMVSTSIVQGTQIIELRVVDTDPARAQALANELAYQLTKQGPAAEQDQTKRRDFVQLQVDDLQTKIEQAKLQIVDLQKSLPVTASARAILDNQQKISTLQAQIIQWQQTYASLLAFLAPQSPNSISILEPARLPYGPVGPNVNQSVLIAGVLGLLLGLAGAFLIEYLDDNLSTSDAVTEQLQLPTIGTIARISGSGSQKLMTSTAPSASVSEAYRVLRTNVQLSGIDRPIKSILVTSPGPGEGKSLTAANLAITMALVGLETILVDTDLRKPAQHRLFNFSNEIGITNALISQTDIDKFLRPTKVENLRVMTAGGLVPNPTEVLASERMRAFMEQLELRADVVIYDSPPCLVLADVPILARLVDGVILVVDAMRTRRDAAAKAKKVLEASGAHTLGVVINRFKPRSGSYRYYDRYYTRTPRQTKPPAPKPEPPAPKPEPQAPAQQPGA